MRANRIIVPGDLVRLDWVDLYGFLGRNVPPSTMDVGLVYTVLSTSQLSEDDPFENESILLTCLRCVDGVQYDLMAHEVQLIAGIEDSQ